MLTLASINCRFVDTLSFMPRSLAGGPSDLRIESIVEKGYFPHTFNITENENYVGPVPDKAYFDVERMSSKKRADFEKWYAKAADETGNEYCLMDECEKYCKNDVLVLRECCRFTKTNFMLMFPDIDLFHQPTNPSAVMLGFQFHYLQSTQLELFRTQVTATSTTEARKRWNGYSN